jgi:hypothetical protein
VERLVEISFAPIGLEPRSVEELQAFLGEIARPSGGAVMPARRGRILPVMRKANLSGIWRQNSTVNCCSCAWAAHAYFHHARGVPLDRSLSAKGRDVALEESVDVG